MNQFASPSSVGWEREGQDIVADLDSDQATGLCKSECQHRLDTVGPNELATEPTRAPLLILGSQFANTMIIVLLVAAVVTVLIGESKDAIVIAAIVTLNALIGFVQEYRAEKAMAALQTMAAPNARVVRDGSELSIPATQLVPGDIVILEAGDIVPADIRLLQCPNLRVNEAALTGESVPVGKVTTPIEQAVGKLPADRINTLFKGTSVANGRARGIVVATGMATEIGQIAGLLTRNKSPRTPLQKRLDVLGKRLAFAAIAVCIVVFFAGIARGEEVTLMFLTAVSLAVAAIPEALPAVVTIALALGASRMVQQHALIRKLPAVETLGSVTVICTDKTGTLTQGKMAVEWVWTSSGELHISGNGYSPAGTLSRDGEDVEIDSEELSNPPELSTEDVSAISDDPLHSLLRVAALCNDAVLVEPTEEISDWSIVGDPTEGALLALTEKVGLRTVEFQSKHPRIDEVPFDSVRKKMITLHRPEPGAGPKVAGGLELVAVKGAVEAILASSKSIAQNAGERPLTEQDHETILAKAEEYAAAGYRVLAFAGKRVGEGQTADLFAVEDGMVMYGLVAMADPARLESADAVAACIAAGITPVMITGDHPATGKAIANRLGILGDRRVITGPKLGEKSSQEIIELVQDIGVYARTSPEQKLDIVQAWKARGEIVAMTGDGVNDAPALRTADIGIAMGVSGTEVAKEAADMVLTDDNFATILTAVGEGRRIYDNIRRFVRYTLTSNSGEIWVMFLGPFIGLPLPLLPVHILWINLVTDGLPGLALGVEPAERNIMHRPPRPPNESIFARGLWQHVAVVGLIMGLIPLGLGWWAEQAGRPWQTMLFTTLALLQLGHALAVRSELDSLWKLGISTNRSLLLAVVGTIALQLGATLWAPTRDLLNIEPLSLFEFAVVIVVSTGVFWAVEVEKAIRRRGVRAD